MLQRRQTAWGKYESKCQQQNMRSNPSLQLNIDKDSVGGFHKVLWVIWDLWCQTRCKSSEGSWEARDKAGGLEKHDHEEGGGVIFPRGEKTESN